MLGDLERRGPLLFWTFWLALCAMIFLFGAFQAGAAKPEGAPESTPAEKNFFNTAHSDLGGSCCSESDGYREGMSYPLKINDAYPHPGGVILREWVVSKDVAGGYRVNIAGTWKDIPPDKVVKSPPNPPNITGAAVVWVTFTFVWDRDKSESTSEISGMTVRCFAPGNQF